MKKLLLIGALLSSSIYCNAQTNAADTTQQQCASCMQHLFDQNVTGVKTGNTQLLKGMQQKPLVFNQIYRHITDGDDKPVYIMDISSSYFRGAYYIDGAPPSDEPQPLKQRRMFFPEM